jgi:alkylation response protein AidB-like acyl-CoA dehydrogenase
VRRKTVRDEGEDAMSSEALTAPAPVTTGPGTTAADVRAAAEALAPELRARASEIEAARRLPPDLLDSLIAAGCFRVLMPPSHDGLGADISIAMHVIEALAAGDGSVGWTVMIGAGSWIDLTGLPRASFDEVFAAPPHPIVAGAINPTGRIVAVDDGYRVEGRWAFASGCEHASWLFGNCVEGIVDGAPALRVALVEPHQAVIEDTWDVVGLSGTGSHHFRIDDVLVPAERTLEPLSCESCIDVPIARVPPPSLFALLVSSVAIGIAKGALEEVMALAGTKQPLFAGTSLAEQPTFRVDLATAATELAAARTFVHEVAETIWDTACSGSDFTLEDRARARAAVVWATDRATAAVDGAYRSGGIQSLYRTSPLQRRLRDIHALTQHFLVRHDALVTAGAILAGSEDDPGVF